MQKYKEPNKPRKYVISKINNSLTTELKATENCDLADKKFRIAVLKKFSELQENSEKQLNDIRGENT